ncbi:MAG: YraN family protein [Sphingomonas sp.]
MKRQRAERGGRRAETLAAWWLRLRGWRILARRARTPVGEIDLVARRGRTLAFVEVKARATAADAALALDDYRLRRVARAAEALAARFTRPGDTIRIDAVFVVPGRLPRHVADIWRG